MNRRTSNSWEKTLDEESRMDGVDVERKLEKISDSGNAKP